APRVKTSPLNRGDRPKWSDIAHLRWSDVAHVRWSELPLADRYSPLLDRYNEILVEAAISMDGSEPTDFVPVFHGLLGDDIRSEHTDDAGVVIHISARDMAKRLQDDVILEPIRFENAYASQIIQGLLNDRFGPGEVQLYVVGEDDFWVDEVTFEYIDTWQAIQSFCEQSDKDVRYLYDPVSGEIRLTYWTPDTTMTPVWNVQSNDIIHETLQTSDAGLRHGVVIRYVDADGNRQQVSIVDESLRKPKEPLRIALIEEADTSYIRDEEAAQRMAQAVFAALRTEPATDLLRIPFNPYMRIYDVIAVENPKLRSEFELYAIEDLQFHFSADEWWTEITASESVKIRHQIWLAKEAKQGVKAPIKGDELRFGDVPGDRLEPGTVKEYILDPAVFAITPSSVPEPSSGSLEDLWDRDPETGVTFPSAPAITFRYPVYQASDAIEVHVSDQARGYVQMRHRDTEQWINVLGSQANPVIFLPGWSYHRFDGGKLYFGREYRLVLLDNVRINELRFERITVADLIMAGKLRLTGDMAIVNEEGTVQITSSGIEMETEEEGGTQWTPGGLVFLRPDGTRSGYLRAIVPGIAEDGDYVPLNFSNEPVIVLSPARAIVHNPSVNALQKLRLEAVDVSPQGFRVVAKLVRHDGSGQRTVFPNTRKWRWRTGDGSYYCTDGGHVSEAYDRTWSEHRLRDVGDTKVFTTGPNATGVIVRIREMLHAHAHAGRYHAENRISYRLRIREVGSPTW